MTGTVRVAVPRISVKRNANGSISREHGVMRENFFNERRVKKKISTIKYSRSLRANRARIPLDLPNFNRFSSTNFLAKIKITRI